MDPSVVSILETQHVQLLELMDHVITALQLMVFVGLMFLLVGIALVGWSVHSVNKRQKALEGKFNLLVDLMLQAAQREVARRHGV